MADQTVPVGAEGLPKGLADFEGDESIMGDYMREYPFPAIAGHGERQGSAAAVQLPTLACKMARIVACVSNVGNVYLGRSNAVTKPDGTTDTTTGLELAPGADTGWLPIQNLNLLWMICDNAGDDITYLCF